MPPSKKLCENMAYEMKRARIKIKDFCIVSKYSD
jgi:hypothetical protein